MFGSDVLKLRRHKEGSLTDRTANMYDVGRTRAAVAAADVVLADSTPLAARVREWVPGTATRIIRFGVDLKRPFPTAREQWRRRLAIDDDAFVVFSSRLWHSHYNIDTIIRALPLIGSHLPKAVLRLKEFPRFSDRDYRRHCHALVEEIGVRDAVRLVGELNRDELLQLNAAADVYVSVPSRDGTAVSLFEAMASGVAVVASDVSGVDPEILRHDETALLVPAGDPVSLAAAVVALGSDPSRRNVWSSAGV